MTQTNQTVVTIYHDGEYHRLPAGTNVVELVEYWTEENWATYSEQGVRPKGMIRDLLAATLMSGVALVLVLAYFDILFY